MHCMKCGRKAEDSHAFCDECLEDMKKYPIKPGTVVRLPEHSKTAPDKKRQKKHLTFHKAADQITALRNRSRWLTAALIVTFLCFLAAAFMVMYLLKWHEYISLPFSVFP